MLHMHHTLRHKHLLIHYNGRAVAGEAMAAAAGNGTLSGKQHRDNANNWSNDSIAIKPHTKYIWQSNSSLTLSRFCSHSACRNTFSKQIFAQLDARIKVLGMDFWF